VRYGIYSYSGQQGHHSRGPVTSSELQDSREPVSRGVERWHAQGYSATWFVAKLRQGCAALRHGSGRLAACRVGMMAMLGVASLTLWRFRRSCSIALSVGLLAGVIGCVAGPVLSSVLCGLDGMALSLSSMVLLPLWRLPSGNVRAAGA
jgi:hypothetical protein